MGAAVRHGNVKSASRMNSAVVIFLDCTDKVNQLVENGLVIQGTLTLVIGAGNGGTEGQFVPPLLRVEEKKRDKISSSVCV